MNPQSYNNSNNNNNNNNSKNVHVITNVDSLLGYALAYRILEAMQNKEDQCSFISNASLRILCRDRQGLGLKKLEEMGAEVHQVNYKEEDKIRQCLKGVRSVTLIPENSRERVKEACNLMKAAKHQQVEHCGLISIVGVNRLNQGNNNQQQGDDSTSHECRNFKEYHEIEKMVKEHFQGKKHCIVRHQIFNQLFYFLAPQIEGENKLQLPVKKDSKWGSINLNDVVEGIWRLCKKQHENQGNNLDKQEYDFTIHRSATAEQMAREIGEGLGRESIHYEQVSEDHFRKHLERMREDKRFKERPESRERFGKGRDGFWSVPVGKFLNEENIQTTMEYLKLACKGYLDHTTDDLKKLLDRNPQDLNEYMKVNRDMFKRFK